MKRALIQQSGHITDIVEPGDEFDVYTGPGAKLHWVDAPDEVTLDWKMEFNEWIPNHNHVDPLQARVVGYGDQGSQMARIYDDIKDGLFGEDAKKGKFFRAIESVKAEASEKYGEIQIDPETGKPWDPYQPWEHNDLIPAWWTREEAEAEYPSLKIDKQYQTYVKYMVEGDGCKWDNAETEPLLPREEKDEDYN